MHAALSAAYLFLFSAIIWKRKFFRLEGISSKAMLAAFYLKILFGLLLWAIYTWHYSYRDTSDSYRFYDDAMIIRQLLGNDPEMFFRFMFGIGLDKPDVQPVLDQMHGWTAMYSYGLTFDSPTIIRINVLISFFSFGYYHVHTVFMCMLSFIGLTGIFRGVMPMFKDREKLLYIACFLLPSVLFWSSGVLKEAPLIFALGLFILYGLRLYRGEGRMIHMVLMLLCAFLLVHLKIYVLISLIPSIVFLYLVKLSGKRFILIKFAAVSVGCFLIALHAHYFFSGGDFLYVLAKKQTDFYNVARDVGANSMIPIPPVTDVWSFIASYPRAVFLSLFRPHLFEVQNLFYLPFAIENACYFLLMIIAFFRFKKPGQSDLPVLLAMAGFIVVLCGIIGNTVPILGAVVRYRIVMLPFFVILLFAIQKPVLLSWLKVSGKQGG